jgi:hypothetical protein
LDTTKYFVPLQFWTHYLHDVHDDLEFLLNPLTLPTFDEGVDKASKKMLQTLCIKAEEAAELEGLTVTMHRQVIALFQIIKSSCLFWMPNSLPFLTNVTWGTLNQHNNILGAT